MLDSKTLNALSSEDKSKLQELETMFNTVGWKYFQQWVKNSALESRDRIVDAANWDTSVAWKGRYSVFTSLLNFEKETYAEFESLASAQEEELRSRPELDFE